MTNPYDDYLKAVEARAKAATPGPWRICQYKPNQLERADGCSQAHNIAETDWNKDAEFIAHARTDVSVLTARVMELTGLAQELFGIIRAHEFAIRADDGNTNFAVAEVKVNAVLAAAPPKEAM